MIQKIGIKNYKSIVDDEIELGRINVFIGENGAGKSNILEAVAVLGVAKTNKSLSVEWLYAKGVRVTKPSLMLNSFSGFKEPKSIKIEAYRTEIENYGTILIPEDKNDRYSKWIDKRKSTFQKDKRSEIQQILKNDEIINEAKRIINEMKKEGVEIINKEKLNQLATNITERTSLLKLNEYVIYTLNTLGLRGINQNSRLEPLGINGEGLDILISTFTNEEMNLLKEHSYFISWLKEVMVDEQDLLKFKGHKLNRSISRLYFKDQFMKRNNNIFAAENANEGALYVLFYLALFISKKTPSFFAIDNIETALNPKLCRELMKSIAALSEKTDKQALITTHNPAILDGINLNDDEQRLFVVSRNDEGHTKTRRIKLKPELWMRGKLGAIPNNFI